MSPYRLTYIYHDCFMYETSEVVILFDFWKDPLSVGRDKDFPPILDEIDPSKRFYVVISHHHKDHFTRRIFLWTQRFPDIKFIISADVFKAVRYMLIPGGTYAGHRPPLSSVHVLSPGDEFCDEFLRVRAFGSTDIGNSYAIECAGRSLFHAGDLNAWLWIDESTPEEISQARDAFTSIVEEIKTIFPSFSLVMFPVDSRLGREYWWGARYFLSNILVSLFVPMHFELVLSENEKEQRRIDAAAFNLFARSDFGACLQLASTRSSYYTAD